MTSEVRLARAPARGLRRRLFTGVGAERILSLASPLLLLALWEGLGRVGLLDQRFFPAPSAIASTFAQQVLTGELPRQVVTSLGRVLVGFAWGAIPALVLGILMGLSRYVRAALKPMVGAIYPIPKTAIFPLLLIIFGLGEGSKYAVVAIGVFFLVLLNTMAGVLTIDDVYLDVGRNFGARPLDIFTTIALPGALPLIFTGVRLAWGNALLLIVVAEMIGARSGLGYFIWSSYQTFAIEELYVGLVAISFIGYLSFLALDELQRWLVPWKGAQVG